MKLQDGWLRQQGSLDGFEETWQVVNDASRYSFNASHSLSYAYDSLYGAYLKSHYPLEYYTATFNLYDGDVVRTPILTKELNYFNIELRQPKFRYSRAEYMMDKETNSIYKGIASLKYLNQTVAEELYELRDNQYDTFIDLLSDVLKTSINSRQLTILISTDFFSEFGKSGRLMKIYETYTTVMKRKTWKKDALPCSVEIMQKYANKGHEERFKQYSDINQLGLAKELCKDIQNVEMNIKGKLDCYFENVGYSTYSNDNAQGNLYYVIDIEHKKRMSNITAFNLKRGTMGVFKIGEGFQEVLPISKGDLFELYDFAKKPKKERYVNDEGKTKWRPIEGEFYFWLTDYYIYNEEDIIELTETIG